KVERIDHFHVGEQIDSDGEFGGLLRKHETRQPIAVRVLLPVHEMLGRRDVERITRDAGAAVRRRPQPHDLRAEADRPVIAVVRCVMEADEDRHAVTRYARICPLIMQYPCKFRAAVNTFRGGWVKHSARRLYYAALKNTRT